MLRRKPGLPLRHSSLREDDRGRGSPQRRKGASKSSISTVCLAIGLFFIISATLFLIFRVHPVNSPSILPNNSSGSSKLPLIRPIRPLSRPEDRLSYTVRINTWKRPELLDLSVQHYLTCPNVAKIQIVWCRAQGPPPAWYDNEERVVVEAHDVNSLNERFRLLEDPPTLGILSVDDDVLRPCQALDVGFDLWLQEPSRLVGYDARSHGINWTYAYLSETTHTNRYSITLTRYCFVHADHLQSYTTDMPVWIRQFVDDHLNCEDIAMSLWVSYQTQGQVPLLAPLWASKSQIKLYHEAAISSNSEHKQVRDECVRRFSEGLDLRDRLKARVWVHKSSTGREPDWWSAGVAVHRDSTEFAQRNHLSELRERDDWKDLIQILLKDASWPAVERGLIEKTEQWKKRFGKRSSGD